MTRLPIAFFLFFVSSGCSLLSTPCGRVAGSICTIPGEEGACASIRAIERSNESAQNMCSKIEESAAAYAREPTSVMQKGRWVASRALLAGAGLVGRLGKAEGELEKAGRAVEKAAKSATKAVEESIEELLED